MDERLQNLVSRWLEEETDDEDAIIISQVDDNDEEHVTESNHNSETEQEHEESEEEVEERRMEETASADSEDGFSSDDNIPLNVFANYYKSKNGTRWYKTAPTSSRTRSHNILVQQCGPKGNANNAQSPLSCFELFFDEESLQMIVDSTNIYIGTIQSKYERDRVARLTNIMEIRAFIGLLLAIGVNRAGRRNLKDFWDNSRGTGIELVYLTMALNRFRFLLRSIRFDDVTSRPERQSLDRLAAIRDLVEKFISNCKNNYNPSELLTIDEQLVAFRGRCGFIMYMPNKPSKFGIKIIMVVDAKFPYIYNFEVYVGEQPEGPFRNSNKVLDVTLRVLDPIYNLGCNVTMDNWFTSIPLAQELLKRKTTLVGTLKSNKPEIPSIFKTTERREEKSTVFGFQHDSTLVSYVPKKKKTVIMLSTMHHDGIIDLSTGEKQKPEIITFYNKTKCGVDVIDKMCNQYNVSRNSRRWPLTLFFDLLNLGGINSLVIHQMNRMANSENAVIVRRTFLLDVAFELRKPVINFRIESKNIPREIRTKAQILLKQENEGTGAVSPMNVRRTGKSGRCAYCPRARDRSASKFCKTCNKWICPDHQVLVCSKCYENNSN